MSNLSMILGAKKVYATKWMPLSVNNLQLPQDEDGKVIANSNPYPAKLLKEFCELYPSFTVIRDAKYNKLQALMHAVDGSIAYYDLSINSGYIEGDDVNTEEADILELGRGVGPYDVTNSQSWCMRIE